MLGIPRFVALSGENAATVRLLLSRLGGSGAFRLLISRRIRRLSDAV